MLICIVINHAIDLIQLLFYPISNNNVQIISNHMVMVIKS